MGRKGIFQLKNRSEKVVPPFVHMGQNLLVGFIKRDTKGTPKFNTALLSLVHIFGFLIFEPGGYTTIGCRISGPLSRGVGCL